MKKFKVVIFMLAYNHEDYIGTAIESVLMQKVNFDYSIIISEDCSTDRTREICFKYKNLFPDKIQLILQDYNVGPVANTKVLYQACFESSSTYVAFLESDDYWSDVFKLQTQVDFLDKNIEYIGCFHNTEERFENSNKASFLYCNFFSGRRFTFSDLCKENIVPTCSIVFRNKFLDKFPENHFKILCGDWALHLFILQFGDYWYIPKVMGVHRYNNSSIWSGRNQKRNESIILETYNEFLKIYSHDSLKYKAVQKGKVLFFIKIKFKLARYFIFFFNKFKNKFIH